MQTLFTWLTHAIGGNPAVAIMAAFAWGVLSIILSPCHLASIPLIVAFIDSQHHGNTRRAAVVATAFAVGILITVAVIGILTAAAGRLAGDIGPLANYAVAIVFFAVGLHLLDVMPLPLPGPAQVRWQRKGIVAAFVLGLIFGIALGPCTFAFMAPVLGVVFNVARSNIVYSSLLLLAYAIGHCIVIVLAGTFSGMVQRYMDWNSQSKGPLILRRACGALVLLGGLYLVYAAPPFGGGN